MRNYKQSAVDFLTLVVAGKIDEAYEKYTDPRGRHHNVYFPAGFAALREAMKESHARFPAKQVTFKISVGEGNLVAVLSRLQLEPGGQEMTITHWFRFENGKIAELWDSCQSVPPDSPNRDGAF